MVIKKIIMKLFNSRTRSKVLFICVVKIIKTMKKHFMASLFSFLYSKSLKIQAQALVQYSNSIVDLSCKGKYI